MTLHMGKKLGIKVCRAKTIFYKGMIQDYPFLLQDLTYIIWYVSKVILCKCQVRVYCIP